MLCGVFQCMAVQAAPFGEVPPRQAEKSFFEYGRMDIRMIWKKKRYLVLVFSALSVFLSGISADLHGAVEQERKGKDNPLLGNSRFQPRLGTYHYAFEFNGLNIGTAWVVLDRKEDLYEIQFMAKTNNTIDRVYKVRFSGGNVTQADSLAPVTTRILSRVRSTSKDTAIRFRDDGTITSVRTESKKGEPLENDVREVRTEDFTMDPLSVVHLIRGIDWKPGMEQTVQVFTGKSRYESRFTCSDETVIEIGGQKRKAWEIIQESRKLDKEGRETDEEKRERDLKIYVSADEARDVLKLDARRAMGHFLVLLEGFKPAAREVRQEGRPQGANETAQGSRS